MTTTACQVIETARRELGVIEEPTNLTKYGRWFGLDGQPWCAIFVTWAFSQAGMDLRSMLGPGIEYTPTFAALGVKAGWQVAEPQAGDICLFRFPSMGRISHVGIVVEPSGTSIVTIEGNTTSQPNASIEMQRNGGMVAQRVRARGLVPVLLRPPYEPCSAPPPAQPPADADALAVLAQAIRDAKKTVLRRGSKGPAVVIAQTRLGIKADGDFGPLTQAAVTAWQRAHGLVADGIVGPATWASLYPG